MQVVFYNYSVLHLIISGRLLLLQVDFYIIAVHLLSVILSEAKDLYISAMRFIGLRPQNDSELSARGLKGEPLLLIILKGFILQKSTCLFASLQV